MQPQQHIDDGIQNSYESPDKSGVYADECVALYSKMYYVIWRVIKYNCGDLVITMGYNNNNNKVYFRQDDHMYT